MSSKYVRTEMSIDDVDRGQLLLTLKREGRRLLVGVVQRKRVDNPLLLVGSLCSEVSPGETAHLA